MATGVRRFINFSDNEPAMKALKDAAARACVGVEAIPRECPVGDHQANGDIESTVRELKRQMRAIRAQLEQKLKQHNGDFQGLDEKDPILTWIPTFAGDVIARCRSGADGKTPWEREAGKK